MPDPAVRETVRYEVVLGGIRPVSARTEVEVPFDAEDPEAAAYAAARQRAGDLDWDCDVGTVELSNEHCRRLDG